MGYLIRTVKKLFFWGYARNTWQYDVLCALILAFIFLSPQGWFDGGSPMKYKRNGEPALVEAHQKSVASRVILEARDNSSGKIGQNEIENRVRILTGRHDIEVLGVEPRMDASGNIVAYEVDIR